MRKQSKTFEERFFQYEIPQPVHSLFDEQLVRSNDLRLLLEIATRSSLRMFTDPKNGNLHFICKQRGINCYDIQAQRHPISHQHYYFPYPYNEIRHMYNCHQNNEAFCYLEIYNLMKLKKKLIEEYMFALKVDKYSPSIILSTLSQGSDQYFFQKYLNGNLEFKRKLRKRFDNIVNIDIKRIGDKQEAEQIYNEQPKIEKIKTSCKQKQVVIRQKEKKKQKQIIEISKIQAPIHKQIQTHRKQEQIVQKKQNNTKSKKINKKNSESHKSKPKKENTQQSNVIVQTREEFPIVMIQQEELPEIKVLNEQAEYIWSSSESESQAPAYERNILNALNTQDYFQSLRNSMLNKSLQRQSLTFCLFSSEPGINNKENK